MSGSDGLALAAEWFGLVLMVAFFGLTAVQLVRYFRTALGMEPVEATPVPGKGAWREAPAAFAVSRLLLVAVMLIFYRRYGGGMKDFPRYLRLCMERWDASHYLGLIRNWYVTEGDAALHLVFMPLYPLLGRGLYLLGMPAFAAALAVSNAALLGCGWALYALVRESCDEAAARRAVWLFMLCPVTFFYSMPYTESVFLLTTLLAVLMARRKRFGWAVFFGALAANARIVGIAAAIPVFWEMLSDARRRGMNAAAAAVCVLKVLPVSAGLIAYLVLNGQLHGNPLQFLIYQREHWGQEFGSLAWTAQYTMVYAARYSNVLNRLGVWIPQLIVIIGLPALMGLRWRKQHPGDAAYGLTVFYASFAPTHLLSGVRYASAIYSVYPMLAAWLKGKWFAAALAAETAMLVYMTVMGMGYGYVL